MEENVSERVMVGYPNNGINQTRGYKGMSTEAVSWGHGLSNGGIYLSMNVCTSRELLGIYTVDWNAKGLRVHDEFRIVRWGWM